MHENIFLKEHSYSVIKIASNAPAFVRKELRILSSRCLADDVFIISETISEKLKDLKEFIIVNLPANNNWKLSKKVEGMALLNKDDTTKYKFLLEAVNSHFLSSFVTKHPEWKRRIKNSLEQKFFTIKASFAEANDFFINDDAVIAVDVILHTPKEELGVPGFDLAANKINLAQDRYPAIDGHNMHVSIKEQFYDTSDIDLRGRFDASPLASNFVTNHANFIATIIAGAGNSIYYAKGVVPAANISSSSFDVILPDAETYYRQDSITVQNHSYGSAIDNSYGINALAFDENANSDTVLLHVFSSGNSGDSTSYAGSYSGIKGYANLTGNFKMAKNVILAGATDSFGNVVSASSRGPAYDGRIKPDIVAFQKNGTSESAALVSGSGIMLQQFYREKNNSVLPSALARAILINSAERDNLQGPDFTSGFGNLNTFKALKIIEENNIIKGSITQDSVQAFAINIPAGISQLKVSLAWNDPAASAFAPVSLINDVDLELQYNATAQRWMPWILNSFPASDSLASPATRGRDSLNNIEQITLQNPQPGKYFIKVKGYNIATAKQSYYIAYSLDSSNYFEWQFPVAKDLLEAGRETNLRWCGNFIGKGTVEYRYVSSNSWQTIADTVSLTNKRLYWALPDTIAQAQLRMKINNTYFYSDTFSITTLLNPQIGFICNDSILVYWERLKAIQSYRLYSLGKKYMQPFKDVPDTFAVLSKADLSQNFLAVAPLINNIAGQKSYALNYTLQGAACYVNSFLAEGNGNLAKLTLIPGTIYKIDSIVFEKIVAAGNVPVYSFQPSGVQPYIYNYTPLIKGINTFRAKIILINGDIIFSQPQSVFYSQPGEFVIYPVPVRRGADIMVNTVLPDGQVISMYNAEGELVLQKEVQSVSEHIRTSSFQKGIYFYRITKGVTEIQSGKILIL
ncbi:MAG: S8 family peptidase [Ginsengibacter sp.]